MKVECMNPDTILTVKANDLDTDDNRTGRGAVRYPSSGESAAVFVIDPETAKSQVHCTRRRQ
jgi:hypothetical protein